MNDEVITTDFGKFLIRPGDIIGETLRAGTLWDGPGFLQVIAKEYAHFGTWGETILDVGANNGCFSIYCAKQGAWRVIAVEAVPATFRYLQASLDLNKATCADVVIPICVAAYDQFTKLWGDPIDGGNMGGTALYPPSAAVEGIYDAAPIDSYLWLFGSRVSLIKVDAQGCDLLALQGLRQTIERDRPTIIFEWEAELAARHHQQTLVMAIEFLNALDYDCRPWPTHSWNFLATPRPPK